MRDAGGEIFDVVVCNYDNGESTRYTTTDPYKGNLLTGSLAGEDAETIERYTKKLQTDSFSNFLVNSYKEARQETNYEFQYVRFWNILEVLAESKNYPEGVPLLNFEGENITKDNSVIRVKSAVTIVYSLFRDSGISNSKDAWENINIWFAFRNSVTHHGSIRNYENLSRPDVREWGRKGMEKIQSVNNSHDPVLWNLKEVVKMILTIHLSNN